MTGLCTLLGGVVGLLLAGVPGGLLGAILGQVIGRRWGRASLSKGASADFLELLFRLLGQTAKAEGRLLEAHLAQAQEEMQTLGLDGPACGRAVEAFIQASLTEAAAHQLRALGRDWGKARQLLSACWRMAVAAGPASLLQRQQILLWGGWMGWLVSDIEALAPAPAPLPPPLGLDGDGYGQALALLGISPDAELEAVKAAYRRLLSQTHPDKIVGGGASAERIRLATDQTRRLRHAYVLVRQRLAER